MLTMVRQCVDRGARTPAISFFWGDIFRPFSAETWVSGWSDMSDFSARPYEIHEGEVVVPCRHSQVLGTFDDGHRS